MVVNTNTMYSNQLVTNYAIIIIVHTHCHSECELLVTGKSWDRSSTQYYNVQYTEGVACGYHKVEHLRLRIHSLHSTVL